VAISLTFDFFAKLILLCLLVRVLWNAKCRLFSCYLGVLLNFAYVVYVGGDFMTAALFPRRCLWPLSALSCRVFEYKNYRNRSYRFMRCAAVAIISLFVLALLVESPLKVRTDSGFDADEGYRHYSWRGILNERNFYFKTNSLWAYVHEDEAQPFPNHKWCKMGINAAAQNKPASDFGGIGMYGYCAGLNLLVIDNLALGEAVSGALTDVAKEGMARGALSP
jgi:hypothetical protein